MMSEPFALLVLSYNHPDLTARCLNSALQFVNSKNIFLVHNGSLQKHQDQLTQSFADINHLIMPLNKGYSGGANFGFKKVFEKFKTVLFLTNDTELLQIPENAPFGFNSVKLLRRNSHEIDSIMGALDPRIGRLSHLKKLSDLKKDHLKYVPGTAFWLDHLTFEKLQGFDERFHTYWEDVDFSLRAQDLGLSLGFSEDTVCKHKIGKTCHKDRFYTYDLFQRNRGFCLYKHNLTSTRFYFDYISDLIRFSRQDYKKAFMIFKTHRSLHTLKAHI